MPKTHDLFPGGSQLGGAPNNFAYMINLLGDRGLVASRVGKDELGSQTKRKLESLTLETSFLQIDSIHPTGTVRVLFDQAGQPIYEITESVAWYFLEWTEAWRSLTQRVSAVCFGSLAQRSPESRNTIRQFLHSLRPGTLRVFDANLRQSFYSAEILSESTRLADILKLNHEELHDAANREGLLP